MATLMLQQIWLKGVVVVSPQMVSPMYPASQANRVLVVEDNLAFRETMVLMLGSLGVVADAVSNGLLAVEKCLAGYYELIIMDVQMPMMDGIEATKRIRETEKANSAKRPVVIVGVTGGEWEKECRAAGMNDYYPKPLMRDGLREVLQKYAIAEVA
jgi:FOG: CheY-like receiver